MVVNYSKHVGGKGEERRVILQSFSPVLVKAVDMFALIFGSITYRTQQCFQKKFLYDGNRSVTDPL